jgi:hypothetical protein
MDFAFNFILAQAGFAGTEVQKLTADKGRRHGFARIRPLEGL